MSWFVEVFGFVEAEEDPRDVLVEEGEFLLCPNGRRLRRGVLELPSLAELRQRPPAPGRLMVRQITGDVTALHADAANAGALFQVASQFNMLEMVGPSVTPEAGITGYAHDRTQGPAAAMACAAGLVDRAWLHRFSNAERGQSAGRQIDGAADLGAALGNAGGRLWQMRNGYLLPNDGTLDEIAATIAAGDREALMGMLRIGVQRRTEVTLPGAGHLVDQAYCSALPVSYSRTKGDWEPFARLVLDAAYEATLRAAEGRVFLTYLGGGVFGNERAWIIAAMERALRLARGWALEVSIVSYGRRAADVDAMIAGLG